MTSFPPSPIPPYHRPVRSRPNELLTASGAASLASEVSYLSSTTGTVKRVVLPNGRFPMDRHEFFIPSDSIPVSSTWVITGTFMGYTSLMLNRIGQSAVLEWDGLGWHVIGGNVDAGPEEEEEE